MRKFMILTVLLSIVLCIGCVPTSITTPSITERATPQGSQDELYVRANLWMVDNFKNAESVIQFSDKESGIFKGKYLLYYIAASTYVTSRSVWATITITAKDNYVGMKIDVQNYTSDIYGVAKKEANSGVASLRSSFLNEFQY